MEGNFEIQNIAALEQSAQKLATCSQNLVNNVESLKYILNTVQANWQNEEGADIQSYVEALNLCINSLTNTIIPTISKYVTTMNTLASSTRATASKTVADY